MIKIENIVTPSAKQMEAVIRGMRNPMNSWDKSDSEMGSDGRYTIGSFDENLMYRLSMAGSTHRKYMRMMPVYCDILAPLYWWKEFDTYKVGTVANSCSTMHKIHEKEFELSDFSHEHLSNFSTNILKAVIDYLNSCRRWYLSEVGDEKTLWWQMIQLLPSSYNQRRTTMLNYEVLARMYNDRKQHKLDEWRDFCKWIETLPYANLMCQTKEGDNS